jgi:hypothetical protein
MQKNNREIHRQQTFARHADPKQASIRSTQRFRSTGMDRSKAEEKPHNWAPSWSKLLLLLRLAVEVRKVSPDATPSFERAAFISQPALPTRPVI